MVVVIDAVNVVIDVESFGGTTCKVAESGTFDSKDRMAADEIKVRETIVVVVSNDPVFAIVVSKVAVAYNVVWMDVV